MGLFDAAAPLFTWVDTHVAVFIPPAGRLILWGTIGAVVSMLLYRALSAQDRIAGDKQDLREARRRLDAFDGEFADAWPLIRNLLRLSFKHVGSVGWPAIVASLPLLFLLGFVSSNYGYGYPPPGAVPEIQTVPPSVQVEWLDASEAQSIPHIVIADSGQRIIKPLETPVPVIHKRQWWNVLMDNPAGYLPEDGGVERITLSLPRKAYLPFGPGWMQGWETLFFLSLVVVSLVIKIVARIE